MSTVCLIVLQHIHGSSLKQVFGWIWITGLGMGGSFWINQSATHLVLQVGGPVSFDGQLLILAAITALCGCSLILALTLLNASLLYRAGCGLFIGAVLAITHYIGLNAIEIDSYVTWNPDRFLITSFIASLLMATALAIKPLQSNDKTRTIAAGITFSLAVMVQHIIGYGALEISYNSEALAGYEYDNEKIWAASFGLAIFILSASALASKNIISTLIKQSNSKIREIALRDPLTALPNRQAFRERLATELERKDGIGQISVIGIDLNRFKQINDTWGHSAGDAVLTTIAERLKSLDDRQFPARFGGDEFAILARFESEIELQSFTENLQYSIVKPIDYELGKLGVGVSIGVAIHPRDGNDVNALIRNADLAMYKAKIDPGQSVYFYDRELGQQIQERNTLAKDLQDAIDNNQLELHYQIQTDLKYNEVVGYEALLRWVHPELGPIAPSVFIPLAESNGLIVPLGDWVLKRACQDAASWSNPVKVAINLSAVQLTSGDIIQRIHEVLLETGLTPGRLEIELTENTIIRDKNQGLHLIRQLKNLGVKVALDDFGSGHSSLDLLRNFPFDRIKLDKTFAQSISTDKRSLAVAKALSALAKSLDIPLLAEGVETEVQMDQFRKDEFSEVQGYYLGRPAELDAQTMKQPGLDLDTQWFKETKQI